MDLAQKVAYQSYRLQNDVEEADHPRYWRSYNLTR